ncbi:MAG TPA: site-2 protease family protein, partial [Planctomycetia bacterium]|nr:site-2 protease family protein [Planctomycetia bacterium]
DAAADKTWPMHLRGFDLAPIPGLRKRDTIGGATSLAVEQTRSSISALYRMFRQMFVGNVSAKSLAGPLRIGEIIYQLIDWERIGLLLYFTAFLSINLMVINFLPIPVLDGGHMVFLIYEAIFRRRPNERFLNVATWMGVIFLGFVMIFVLSLDLLRFFGIMKS